MPKLITYPPLGNYQTAVSYLLKHIQHHPVLNPKPMTSKTLELGSKNSPDFVCMPFKYTLGTYIEGLKQGANVLFQLGGGCRYGYYSELQIQILKDLGYDFDYINLVSEGKTDIKQIIKKMKQLDPKFSTIKSLYYLFITTRMIKYMDQCDHFIRSNIGFEVENGSFEKLNQKMLYQFEHTKGYFHLLFTYLKYKRKFKKIKINKPHKCLKVGIIGELYTVMEPFANYELERALAEYHISIKRYTNAYYLLFEKANKVKKYLKNTTDYIRYRMGADAADNIARTKEMCKQKYDGIIHIKSAFCTPEIGAMPIIQKIAQEHNIPVLFFSFDSNTSEVGIKTRIEAFVDMLEMRRDYE